MKYQRSDLFLGEAEWHLSVLDKIHTTDYGQLCVRELGTEGIHGHETLSKHMACRTVSRWGGHFGCHPWPSLGVQVQPGTCFNSLLYSVRCTKLEQSSRAAVKMRLMKHIAMAGFQTPSNWHVLEQLP